MKITATNLRGGRIPLHVGAGSFLTKWRQVVVGAVNSFLNLRVVVKRADGTITEADVKQTDHATIITIPIADATVKKIAFKVCRDDGSVCYAVVPVSAIYTLPADSPATPTIDSGKVPNGTEQLT